MTSFCGSQYPLHMSMLETSSQLVLIDKAFSVHKSVRLAKVSHHSHQLLKKIRGVIPGPRVEDLSDTWVEYLLSLEKENSIDSEASGERNHWSINLTHGNYPCHCVAQNVWCAEKSNTCLIWDVERTRAIGYQITNRR